jgi:hypothetical protein
MANDHYVSEFLTKPWGIGGRRPRLHFYDFKRRVFDHCKAETLFAAEGLHTEQTGSTFNRLVENPVNQYRRRLLRGNGTIDDRTYRALASFVWLQIQRGVDAREPGQSKFTLDDLVAQGEALIDAITKIVWTKHELLVVTLASDALPLYFTELVYFPIPMIGTAPMFAVPLTPRAFIALPEKGFPRQQLDDWRNDPSMLHAFSIGIGGQADRVVIPPEGLPARDNDPQAFSRMLRKSRALCRSVFNKMAEMNRIAGFRTFTVS